MTIEQFISHLEFGLNHAENPNWTVAHVTAAEGQQLLDELKDILQDSKTLQDIRDIS